MKTLTKTRMKTLTKRCNTHSNIPRLGESLLGFGRSSMQGREMGRKTHHITYPKVGDVRETVTLRGSSAM
eukprot:2568524-Pyramimonas_sp.AAC.1